jgi:hypothetical protein
VRQQPATRQAYERTVGGGPQRDGGQLRMPIRHGAASVRIVASAARTTGAESPPWTPRTEDLGLQVVDGIAAGMMLDRKWSLETERGFMWWGGPLAQQVWSDSGVDDDGVELFRISARTDVLRDFDASDKNLTVLGMFAGVGTTSALVVDSEARKVTLAANMLVHAETADWVRRVLSLVIAAQVADAHAKAPTLAEMTAATPAMSVHPSSGPRRNTDELLYFLERVVVPMGKERSRWAGEHLQHAFEVVRDSPCTRLATGGDASFIAELVFESRDSRLRVAVEANPQVGYGLLVLLSLPPRFEELEGIRFAHALNRLELASQSGCHFLGSWCCQGGTITHCAFFPNAMRLGGDDLMNLVLSELMRARWIALTANGASPQPDEACWPALVVAVSRPRLVDGLHAGFGVVRRLRPRVARGGWPSRC